MTATVERASATLAFAAAFAAGMPKAASDDPASYPPTLQPGNCAPTSEIQKAWDQENLEVVLGAEARLTIYNDDGEPKRDENGDAIYQDKEYILAANQKREWYTFIGNSEKGGGSTRFCVSIAGNGFVAPNNHDTPQSYPYEDKIDQKAVNYELNGPPSEIQGYIFAQGHAEDSNLTHTMFLTKQADQDGKNFVMYSHKDESRIRMTGDAAEIDEFGHSLAEKYRQTSED